MPSKDSPSRNDSGRPTVLVVGGPDVDQRLDLMRALSGEFDLSAAGSEPALGARFASAGFPYHHFPLDRGESPLADVRSAAALYRLCRRVRPDIVHAYATKPAVWGRIAARRAGVPIVVGTLPGLGSLFAAHDLRTRAVRRIYTVLQRAACRASDLTIFQNQRDAAEFITGGVASAQRSAVMAGSGVRTDHFDPALVPNARARALREEMGAGGGEAVVTMVSRLIRPKGVLEFARAAELVRTRNGRIHFVLVGPDDRDSVDRLTSEELGRVTRAVHWLGERQDVAEILAASDIFVLPSYYREGVPRVLLEAASMGLPLVSTRAPGCEEAVAEDENGILVPPRDVPELARAVERLAGDGDLRRRFGERSRRLALERFDLDVVARETAAHYRRLLSERRP